MPAVRDDHIGYRKHQLVTNARPALVVECAAIQGISKDDD
jgi:hypothetical protein